MKAQKSKKKLSFLNITKNLKNVEGFFFVNRKTTYKQHTVAKNILSCLDGIAVNFNLLKFPLHLQIYNNNTFETNTQVVFIRLRNLFLKDAKLILKKKLFDKIFYVSFINVSLFKNLLLKTCSLLGSNQYLLLKTRF